MFTIHNHVTEHGHTVCQPIGDLDAFTVSAFRRALGELTDDSQLIIDLSATGFIDSAGLGALIGGIRRARKHGGNIVVACERPTLLRLLHTTGLDALVTVAPTLTEAAHTLSTPLDHPAAPMSPP